MGLRDGFRRRARLARDCEVFATGSVVSLSADGRGVIRLSDGSELPFEASARVGTLSAGGAAAVHIAVCDGRKRVVQLQPLVAARAEKALFLRPIDTLPSWSLACGLLRGEGKPGLAGAVSEVAELLREVRGKSRDDLDAMLKLVRWATSTLNPPGASVHQVVGDAGDIELALEQAAPASDATVLAERRALLDRHRD